jgi:glycosyltransferase involved in cell wall biosynthesis
MKGFHLGLQAFAKLLVAYPDSEYWIVNDGSEMLHLKALAKSLGVENKVTFWGRLQTLDAVYSKLGNCDVLVHPALHEAFGNVCLEAMASGRPVVCLDLGGPAIQVTDETGIKVQAISPEQAVASMVEGLSRLASDSVLRLQLGSAGRQRVTDCFDWNEKGKFLAAIYEDAIRVRAHVAKPAGDTYGFQDTR